MKHSILRTLLHFCLFCSVLSAAKAQLNVCDASGVQSIYHIPSNQWRCLETFGGFERDSVPESLLAMTCEMDTTFNMQLFPFILDSFTDGFLISTYAWEGVSYPPIVAIFTGACDDLTEVVCERMETGISYEYDISFIGDTGWLAFIDFDPSDNILYCIYTYDGACAVNHEIEEKSSSSNISPVGGPYCPGEKVEFCITIDEFPFTDSCQRLQGIVPYFGEGWDPSSFNVAGQPRVTQVIAPVGQAVWNWYEDNEVHYNSRNYYLAVAENVHGPYLCGEVIRSCGSSVKDGDGLPRGWYAVSPDSVLPDNHPDNSIGDGGPCGSTGSWQLCFQVKARSFPHCDTLGYQDASIGYTLLGDGEIGSYTQRGCGNNLPVVVEALIACEISLDFPSDTLLRICSGDQLNFALPMLDTVGYHWTILSNVSISGGNVGQGFVIGDTLWNADTMAHSIHYEITSVNFACQSIILNVEVLPLTDGYFNENVSICPNSSLHRPVPTQYEILSIEASRLLAEVDSIGLLVSIQNSAGFIAIHYLNTCANQTYIDTLFVSIVDTVYENDTLLICSGEIPIGLSQPVFQDTTYSLITVQAGCIHNINYFAFIQHFNLPTDTFLNCQDSLLIDARNYSTLNPQAEISWQFPDGKVALSDQIWLTETGAYIVHSATCLIDDTIHVNEGFPLHAVVLTEDCLNGSIELNPEPLQQYAFLWNTGSNESSIQGLQAGIYVVTVTNTAEQCAHVNSFLLNFHDSCSIPVMGAVYMQSSDSCDSDVTKFPIIDQKIKVEELDLIISSDVAGEFRIDLPPGVYHFSPILNNQQFMACPAQIEIEINLNSAGTDSITFCILDTSSCQFRIVATSGVVRPSRYISFGIRVSNRSSLGINNVQLTGVFDSRYDLLDYQENTPIESVDAATNTILWNLGPFVPYQTRTVYVKIKLPEDVPPGIYLENILSVEPACSPATTMTQLTRTSFDPNDKTLMTTVGKVNQNLWRSDSMLDYTIRFQNTGNDTAFYIKITDQISENLNLNSLEPGPSSHQYSWRIISNRVVEFIFDSIILPQQMIDEDGSQGFISFSIARNVNAMVDDTIHNSANIFFDFNAPVITNTVSAQYTRPQHVQLMNFTICVGDTFMSYQVFRDTLIERMEIYFDFDSVFQYQVHTISDTTWVTEVVTAGTVVRGDTIVADTIIVDVYENVEGCDSLVIFNITVITGVANQETITIYLFPNPSIDRLFVQSSHHIRTVNLFNEKGEKCIGTTFNNQLSGNLQLHNLPYGLYFVQIITAEEVTTKKIVIGN